VWGREGPWGRWLWCPAPLPVCLCLFGTKKPDFLSALEANSLLTQRSQSKTDPVFTSSHPSPFLRALWYTYIDSGATALVLATLLKGTLQALGRSLEAWGEDLCIGILVPDCPLFQP